MLKLVIIVLLVSGLAAASSDAAGASAPADGVGVVDPAAGKWYLRDPDSGGTTSFYFGDPGDIPFMGDWDCAGADTPGSR
jgi:hypothetical protein